MRVSDGARKINSCGGAIFIHDDWIEEKRIGIRVVADIPQSPIVPIEIRDFVYGKLIELSPATLYPGSLIAGEKGLLTRGLNECHFDNYGGLPAGSRERDRIAQLLLQEINDRFPSAGSLRGIPGFWEDRQGVHLWKTKDYLLPRLLIPVRDGSGRIQACQMRLPLVTKTGLRYLWLSTSDLPHGTRSGSPLHFKFRLADIPHDAWIVIVEGVLKADVLSVIHPELFIAATPCVTANQDALVELTHGRPVLIAFDQDYNSNQTVCFHLAALVAWRLRRERTLETTRIALWEAQVKGIDDAAVRNLPITAISVQRWLDSLNPRFRKIAMTRLSEIAAVPLRSKSISGSQLTSGDGVIRPSAARQLATGDDYG
jgi:Domain of unknown function (DUF3854)